MKTAAKVRKTTCTRRGRFEGMNFPFLCLTQNRIMKNLDPTILLSCNVENWFDPMICLANFSHYEDVGKTSGLPEYQNYS